MDKALVLALVLVACPGFTFAQGAGGKRSSLGQSKASDGQMARYREEAKVAFDREMAREKAGDCKQADTTFAIVKCLGAENDTTSANYVAYAGALRSLLGLSGEDGESQSFGLSGKPLTSKELVKDFEATEAAWQKYRTAQCSAAFNLFRGGSVATPQAGFCELMLVRSHMREVDYVYSYLLHQ